MTEKRRSRAEFLASARRYAADCAASGATWDETWARIDAGFTIAGLEPTVDERLALYEAFDGAFAWETAA